MSVNGIIICGLTHAQAVAALKAASNFDKVLLLLAGFLVAVNSYLY
jgi:hypothetical protein